MSRPPELSEASEDRERLLDEIAVDYLEAVRRGEKPDRREILARHAELREELEAFFEEVERFDGLAAQTPAGPSAVTASPLELPRELGSYDLLEEIGRGGMGVVYRARQRELGREVAIKVLLAGRFASASDLRRFRREAEATAALDHPDILPIHEVGEWDGVRFFSTRLLGGGSLSDRRGTFTGDSRAAARLVARLAAAMQYAHARGVLHRDLKPANVLLDDAGEPVISDFGLAMLLSDDRRVTRTGAVLGTPNYMAPEQAAGRQAELGAATDVYSLGAILFELLTGRAPFESDSSIDTLRRVVEDEPERPRSLNAAVPVDLEAICLRCLEKSPARRYRSAGELAADLGRFLAGEVVEARRIGPLDRGLRWCRRNPAALTIWALLLVIGFGGSLSAVWMRSRNRLATRRLFESRLDQAKAVAVSHQAGQRTRGLAAIREAASLVETLEPSEAEVGDLRNAAVKCLALAEIREYRRWETPRSPGSRFLAFDSRFARYAEAGQDISAVSVVDAEAGRRLTRLPGPAGNPAAHVLRFSPDDRLLVVKYGNAYWPGPLWVWRWERAQAAFKSSVEAFGVAADFSPAGDSFAWADAGGTIRIHDVGDWGETGQLHAARGCARLRFDPDGQRIAVSNSDTVQIWSRATSGPELLAEFSLPRNRQNTAELSWHPEGTLLAGTAAGQVIIWDIRRAREVREFTASETSLTAVAFGRNGDLLATSDWEAELRLWSPAGIELARDAGVSYSLSFGRDDRLLGPCRNDKDIALWEVETSRTLHALHGSSTAYNSVAVHPGGRLLACAGREDVVLWDLASGRERVSISSGPVGGMQFHPLTGDLWTLGDHGLLRWPLSWAGEPGESDLLISGPQRIASISGKHRKQIALSADGRYLAAADEDSTSIFDLRDGTRTLRRLHHARQIHWLALSPGGEYLAAGPHNGSHILVWDLSDGARVAAIPAPVGNFVARVLFSPDGAWLLTGTGNEFAVRRTGTWEVQWRFERPNPSEGALPLAISADGRTLAIARWRWRVQLIDLATGHELVDLEAPHRGRIEGLAFTPDGTALASAVRDYGIRVWDLRQLRSELRELGLDWGQPPFPARPLEPALDLGARPPAPAVRSR